MEYLFAPLEGITYPEFRKVHARLFPGAAEYYAPFIAPGSGGFKPGFLKKHYPDSACGYRLIPQLLANNAELFLETANLLADMGFDELNLNIGCPSGTVFAKHKGAGMLTDLSSLQIFLDKVFAETPVKLSIKTRMGVESTGEFAEILRIYNAYPVSKLIVHARSRSGYYKSPVDRRGVAAAMMCSDLPICYNGDVFSSQDLNALMEVIPGLASVMIGRGAVANPALIRMLSGGKELSAEELQSFLRELLEAYRQSNLGESVSIRRMKELWYYMGSLFPGGEKRLKAILKARNTAEYENALSELFASGCFNGQKSFINL